MKSFQDPIKAQIEAKKTPQIDTIQKDLERVKQQLRFRDDYLQTIGKVIELLNQADNEVTLSNETSRQLKKLYNSLNHLATPGYLPKTLTQTIITTSMMIKKEITQQCIEKPLAQLSQEELYMKFTSRFEDLQELQAKFYTECKIQCFAGKKIITLHDVQEINSWTREIIKTMSSGGTYNLQWEQQQMELVITLLQEGYDTKIEQYIARIRENIEKMPAMSSTLETLDYFLEYLQSSSFKYPEYGVGNDLPNLNKTYINHLFESVDKVIPVKKEKEEKTTPAAPSNTRMFSPTTNSEKIAKYNEEVSVLNEVLKKHGIEIKANPPSTNNINAVHFRIYAGTHFDINGTIILKLFKTEKIIAENAEPYYKEGFGYFYCATREKLSRKQILSLTEKIRIQFPDERLTQTVTYSA